MHPMFPPHRALCLSTNTLTRLVHVSAFDRDVHMPPTLHSLGPETTPCSACPSLRPARPSPSEPQHSTLTVGIGARAYSPGCSGRKHHDRTDLCVPQGLSPSIARRWFSALTAETEPAGPQWAREVSAIRISNRIDRVLGFSYVYFRVWLGMPSGCLRYRAAPSSRQTNSRISATTSLSCCYALTSEIYITESLNLGR